MISYLFTQYNCKD